MKDIESEHIHYGQYTFQYLLVSFRWPDAFKQSMGCLSVMAQREERESRREQGEEEGKDKGRRVRKRGRCDRIRGG